MQDKTFLDIEGYGGDMYLDGLDPRDFNVADLEKTVDNLPNNPNTDLPGLNQSKHKKTKYGCTVIGALGQTSYNTGVPTSNREGVEFCIECIKNGTLDEKLGGNSNTNTKEVSKLWNENHIANPVIYGTVYFTSHLVKKLIDKGYTVGVSLGLKLGRYLAVKDKKIEKNENTNSGKYFNGHRPMGIVKRDNKYVLIDNYEGRPHNVIEFENREALQLQWTKGPFRPFVYLVMPVNSIRETLEIKSSSIARKHRELIPDAMSVAYSEVAKDTKDDLHKRATQIRERYNIPRIQNPIYRLVANSLSVIYGLLPQELRESAHQIAEFCRSKYDTK